MWNLSGGDIEKAKNELVGRRAAIKARYDSEMKQLDAKIGEIEAFERAAQAFVLDFKGAEIAEPPAPEPPAPDAAADQTVATASEPADPPAAEAAAEPAGEAAAAPEAGRTPGEKSSSRWRMRLGTAETSA